MKEEKTPVKSSAGKENEPGLENGKKKGKEEKPATKVVVRRLPPSMTEEQFKNQVAPLPDIDYFCFVPADMSLAPHAFCRTYINFVDQADLFIFTQKFDGYVFVDSKGGEFPAVVEFAPFQHIPKNRPNRKKDPKMGTIELDPGYIAFKERFEAETLENRTAVNASKQHFFETSLVPEKKEVLNTPLLDYVKHRRMERQRIRDEKREEKRKKDLERRRAKDEQRRTKKEDDTSVVKTSTTSPVSTKPSPVQPIHSPSCSTNYSVEERSVPQRNKKSHTCLSENHRVPTKVREMVDYFNKSIKESSSKESGISNIPQHYCVEHKAVESEIIRSVNETNKKTRKIFINSRSVLSKNLETFNFPISSHFNESNNITPCYNPMPLLASRGKVFVPCSTARDIVMKPVRVLPPGHRENEIKIDKTKNSLSKTNFPTDAFRKNLQKVVEDVLGHAKVKSPKENEINKPKTFIKRVVTGSGELYVRPGFNSPEFYLPPRSFGCGQGESANSKTKSCDSKIDVQLSSPVKAFPSGKRHFPGFSKKKLPPFSRKSIFPSKSDGDIEKTDSAIKIGGSQESLKRKIEPRVSEVKPQLMRRPHVAPRKCMILNRNNKVTL